MDWPNKKVISPGIQKIFDISQELNSDVRKKTIE
jgi:hypothetical protein